MPGGFLGTPGAGLWPRGFGSHKQRNPDVSQGMSSSLCPTLAIPRFGNVSLGVREQSCRPSWGKSQQLLPSKGCFPALLVAVLPRCWWGTLPSVWFFQPAPAKAACALCQLPSSGVTGSIRTSQTDANPTPSSTERSEAASHQPFPQVFPSG